MRLARVEGTCLLGDLQEAIEGPAFKLVDDQPGPKVGQIRMGHPCVADRQAERVLPPLVKLQAADGLSIAYVLVALQKQDARQKRRRMERTTVLEIVHLGVVLVPQEMGPKMMNERVDGLPIDLLGHLARDVKEIPLVGPGPSWQGLSRP